MRDPNEPKKINYELVSIENGQIVVEQEVMDRIAMLQIAQKQLDDLNARLRMELRFAMEQNGIKKYENDTFSVTYVDASKSRRVDVEKLKEDGLYDEYSYESETNPSVRIKMK